jgi:hypothetical protein
MQCVRLARRKTQFCVEYHIRHWAKRGTYGAGCNPLVRIRITNSAYREHSFVPALRQLRPRLRSGRKAKTMRVAAISTDQLVPCPTCGGFMRLSDAQAFECKQCGRAIRVEGVLKTIDGGE